MNKRQCKSRTDKAIVRGCGRFLDEHCFAKNMRFKDNLNPVCKECWADYVSKKQKITRKIKPDHIREKDRLRRNARKKHVEGFLPPRPDNCELCEEKHDKLVIDHDHKSGFFRGWLCGPCNMLLGRIESRPDFMEAIKNYLYPSPQLEIFQIKYVGNSARVRLCDISKTA